MIASHDWLDVLTVLASILLGLGGIGALITALIYVLKVKTEKRAVNAVTEKTEAETISIYQNIADRSAERALKLDIRITTLEALVQKQAAELQRLREENADLREWAERLVHQVQGLGAEPVKIQARPQESEAAL
jgi:hypothetical protein